MRNVFAALGSMDIEQVGRGLQLIGQGLHTLSGSQASPSGISPQSWTQSPAPGEETQSAMPTSAYDLSALEDETGITQGRGGRQTTSSMMLVSPRSKNQSKKLRTFLRENNIPVVTIPNQPTS